MSKRVPETEKVCPQCGKAFSTTNARKRFCSNKCRMDHFNHAARLEHRHETRKCKWCGKEFLHTNHARTFCSPKCRVDYWNAQWAKSSAARQPVSATDEEIMRVFSLPFEERYQFSKRWDPETRRRARYLALQLLAQEKRYYPI